MVYDILLVPPVDEFAIYNFKFCFIITMKCVSIFEVFISFNEWRAALKRLFVFRGI